MKCNLKTKVSASILAADLSKIGKEVKKVDKSGAEFIHIDVMDGHFVDNISFGTGIIKAIRKSTNKVLDVHLMIDNVEKHAKDFISAGADVITFHAENGEDTEELIHTIKGYGCKVGLAIRPETKINKIKKYLKNIDLILVMSVEPGFAGQTYISQEKRVEEVAELTKDFCIEIEVDGGINDVNSPSLIDAGATILVAGTYIFKSKSYRQAIKKLKG